jgi:hypothetical protein
MIDWLNDNSGAVQALAVLALVLVTALYASFTRRMVREMREQRLAEGRPDLLIDVAEIRDPEWYLREAQNEKCQAEVEPYAFPDVVCRIHNAGRHVAKEVAVTVMNPSNGYNAPRRGFLLPGDTWETSVTAYRDAPAEFEACGLSKWRAEQGDRVPKPKPPRLPPGAFGATGFVPFPDTGVVVYYRDIHDADWATYLIFAVIHIKDATTARLVRRDLLLGDQRRIRLKRRPLLTVTFSVEPWVEG